MNIGQWIHFSIDDVINSLKWIAVNQPDSIFDEPMFGKLKEWHEEYGISCDLYVYEITEDFAIQDIQDRYCHELVGESSWLKLGWHRRKAGLLTDDDATEIDSFNRVKNFITQRISGCSWANILRLHRWEATPALLKHLADNDVRQLLTADSNRLSYDLTEDDMDDLNQNGICHKGAFTYRVTDLRLDKLADEMSVDDCIVKTQQILNERAYCEKPLEVFCHEWQFGRIAAKIDQYWQQFSRLWLPLYVSASTMAEGRLYFTTLNTNSLFCYEPINGAISQVASLPCRSHNCMKYASLVAYQDTIWMIPWAENAILSYNIVTCELKSYPIPYELNSYENSIKYRKAVRDGKYLWLLPLASPYICRLDMEQQVFCCYDNFPKEVTFPENRKMNFKCMNLSGKYLYLFKDGCSHNIRMNVETGKMEIWNIDLSGHFGIVTDENLAWISPTYSGEPVSCYMPENGTWKQHCKTELPSEVWAQEKIYALWYCSRTKGRIWMLPHEANALVYVDTETGKINVCRLETENYKTLRSNAQYAGYEVLEDNGRIYLTPYMGNQILELNHEGEIVQTVTCTALLSELQDSDMMFGGQNFYESRAGALKGFLKKVKCRSNWNKVEYVHHRGLQADRIGTAIYKTVLADKEAANEDIL